jgi:hypothetical protein
MSGGYVIARENFKEAEKHVSAETDPVMFNLIYGLQSLTEQIEMDFAALKHALAGSRAGTAKSGARKAGATSKSGRAAAPKASTPKTSAPKTSKRAGTAKKVRRSR